MREKKEIKLFRLGTDADEFCIVFTDNYKEHLKKQFTNSDIVSKFIDTVVMETTDVSLSKSKMVEFGFSDVDITWVHPYFFQNVDTHLSGMVQISKIT